MTLTQTQIDNLVKLNVKGAGGKDALLAEALGHERANERLYDATDPAGIPWEYKKQSKDQWLDLIKLSELTEEEKDIGILWFNHKAGKIHSVYLCTYRELMKTLGIGWLSVMTTRLFKIICGGYNPQVKISVKEEIILKGTPLYSAE